MKIAIVGTGISGLVCAHLLRDRHELVLFEAERRIGGHTNTVDVGHSGRRYPIDTGFIVFNEHTYPGFSRLLAELGVGSRPSDMSHRSWTWTHSSWKGWWVRILSTATSTASANATAIPREHRTSAGNRFQTPPSPASSLIRPPVIPSADSLPGAGREAVTFRRFRR